MRAILEAHPLASLLVMVGTIAVCLLALLWADTRDDARHEIADHAAGFDGAWPYLEEIAAAIGAGDPLEDEVVRSYWIGGPQLAAVDGTTLARRLRSAFADQPTGVLDKVDKALAHHSFHVFAVYPWVRFLDVDPSTPLRILQACPVPVVPIALNNLWGSYFSRVERGRAMVRPFRRAGPGPAGSAGTGPVVR